MATLSLLIKVIGLVSLTKFLLKFFKIQNQLKMTSKYNTVSRLIMLCIKKDQ